MDTGFDRRCVPCVLLLGTMAFALIGHTGMASGDFPKAAVLTPADVAQMRAWVVYPVERVMRFERLPAEARAGAVSVSAARNEYEPFLIVIRPRTRRPVLDLRFVLSSVFRNAEGDGRTTGITVTCRRVGYVFVDRPSGSSVLPDVGNRFLKRAGGPFGITGRTGFFPDRLLPFSKTFADPGENTQFWFTVRVASGVPAGTWRGDIEVRLRGAGVLRVPLVVRVYHFSLPRAPDLWNVTCWSPQEIVRFWNDEDLREFYRWCAGYGQVIDPIVPQPDLHIGPDDQVAVTTEAYERMLRWCMQDLGMPCVFFPRVGSAWYTNFYFLWHTPVVRKQRWYGVPIFDEQLRLTDRFRRVFGAYVRKMLPVFARVGCEDRVLMTTMDEPHTAEDRKAVREFGAFVKRIAPGVKLFCTTYPCDDLAGIIDVWCPQEYRREEFARRRRTGDRLLFYKNWLHLIDAPLVSPRVQGWIAWKMGADGWITYATMGRWKRAWDAPYAVYANTGIQAWGLGLLWYPDLLQPRILSSVRWEMMREGREDHLYLRLLSKAVGGGSGAGVPETLVREGRRLLETGTKEMIHLPEIFPSGEDKAGTKPAFATSNRTAHALRIRIADLLERIQRARPHPEDR